MRLFRRNVRGKPSKIWTVEFKIPGQEPIRRSTGETSKNIAYAKAQRWQEELNEKRRKKIMDPDWVDPDSFDLVERLADWRTHMEKLKRTEKHISSQIRHTIEFFELAGTESPHELTENVIRQCLAKLTCAQRTKKNKLLGLTAFFNYLKRIGEWRKNNPTENVEIGRVEKLRQRRALTTKEISALIETAPIYRRLAYMMALLTGLRRKELDQLKFTAICFEAKTITLQSTLTKNRKPDVLPLVERLIAPLVEWRDTGYKDIKVGARGASVNAIRDRHELGFAVPAVPRVSSLHIDLRAAGVEIETDLGIIDFHALRYTFGSQLIERGLGIEAVSRLMRHANIHQTASTYIVHGIDKRRKDIGLLRDLID
jgi:integrase